MLADQVGVRKQRGATVLYVVREDKVVGALSLEDTVRPESRQAVEELHRLGKRVVMITGDARQVAEAVAAELGGRRGVRRGPTRGQGSAVADLQRRGLAVAMVGDGVRLSQASYRKMLQNLGWATGYNLVPLPLAAGVLAWAGLTLAPAVGAILMSASTIVVALNAQLLRRLDLRPT